MYDNANERLSRHRQRKNDACMRNLKWSLATAAVLSTVAGCIYYISACISLEDSMPPASFDIKSAIDTESPAIACLETSTNDISTAALSTFNQTLVQLTRTALFSRSTNYCESATFLGTMSHSCEPTVFWTSAADGSNLRQALGKSLEAAGGTPNKDDDFNGVIAAVIGATFLGVVALPLLYLTACRTIDAISSALAYRNARNDILSQSLLTDEERANTAPEDTAPGLELQAR